MPGTGERGTTAKDEAFVGRLVFEVLATVGVFRQAFGKGLRQLSRRGPDMIDGYRGLDGVNASEAIDIAGVQAGDTHEIRHKGHGITARAP